MLDDVLRIERLLPDDLKEEARRQGIADVGDVQIGVLEADGKFSFVRGSGERPPRGGEAERSM
jgi:uncharacterized membrane protein YcaP (DUF421 family)